ncbi:MAG: hypothetical protein M0D55_09715 [Elusimicrobiota bacterium]|nr:MAG: hypothetical protein M0D55_09715 [Elusimicrobiota bacterium]
MNRIGIVVVTALLVLGAVHARAQEDEGSSGLSRPMRVAVRFYEQGEDIQAMDRFMEILTKGDPSERSMANEYINLITHRMNTSGGKGGAPAPQPGVTVAEPVNPNVASPIKRASPAGREVPETISEGPPAAAARSASTTSTRSPCARTPARSPPRPAPAATTCPRPTRP